MAERRRMPHVSLKDKMKAMVHKTIEDYKFNYQILDNFICNWDRAIDIRNKETLARGDYLQFFKDLSSDYGDMILFGDGKFDKMKMNKEEMHRIIRAEMLKEVQERKEKLLEAERAAKAERPTLADSRMENPLHTEKRTRSFAALVAEANRQQQEQVASREVKQRHTPELSFGR